jgi:hypothetical protein
MDRRDISKALFAAAAGSAVVAQRAQAQSCTAPCYAQTPAEIAATVTPVNYAYAPGNVLRYGAKGDGTTDDTAAFQAALQCGYVAYAPYNNYKITKQLNVSQGGIVGDNWGTATGTYRTQLTFYNLTGTTSSAIHTPTSPATGTRPLLENLYILASSWSPATGCSGYGLDIEAPVICRNVTVVGFPINNLFLHNDANGIGPYQSLFDNFYGGYSGQHGVVVGTGANTVTFINLQSKWSGTPSYLLAPFAAGNYDGFYIDVGNNGTPNQAPGNPGGAFYSYVPVGVVVIGGDCSYNSRYGWNFSACSNCNFQPAYAEGNLAAAPGQVNLGLSMSYTTVIAGSIAGNAAGINCGANYSLNLPTNTVILGGQSLGSGDSNTTPSQFHLSNKNAYFGYSSGGSNLTYINSSSSTGVATLGVAGTGYWNLGAPLRYSNTQVLGQQQNTGVDSSSFTANSGTSVNSASTFDGYTLAQVVKALRLHGLIA